MVLLRPDTSKNVMDVCGICGAAVGTGAAMMLPAVSLFVSLFVSSTEGMFSSALWSTQVSDVRAEAPVDVYGRRGIGSGAREYVVVMLVGWK
jgi:hypothetical protein